MPLNFVRNKPGFSTTLKKRIPKISELSDNKFSKKYELDYGNDNKSVKNFECHPIGPPSGTNRTYDYSDITYS